MTYPVIFGPESGSVFDKVRRPLGSARTHNGALSIARRKITVSKRERLTAMLVDHPDLENQNDGVSVVAWFVGVSLK